MQEQHVFEYAFIRLVPRVERAEFINVGVILFCKKKHYLKVKYHLDEKRLRALFQSVDLEDLADYLNTWDLIGSGLESGGAIATLPLAERFRWLTATRSTIIQSSPNHTGLCSDPEKVLQDLFEKYVL